MTIGIIILIIIILLCIFVVIFIIYNYKQMKGYSKEKYEKNIKEFVKYDGCSGGMSILWKMFGKVPPWENCCDIHDQPYFKGGTESERKAADIELRKCVKNNGHSNWGNLMYYLVRIGGSPLLPFSWRWGYGKPYYTGYQN
jgi:hypothetical protein